MGINKFNRKKEEGKTTNKINLLAFLGKMLIVDNSLKVTQLFLHGSIFVSAAY